MQELFNLSTTKVFKRSWDHWADNYEELAINEINLAHTKDKIELEI